MLNELGIFCFAQVANMEDGDYEALDALLSAFQGRAKRDDWAGQAKALR